MRLTARGSVEEQTPMWVMMSFGGEQDQSDSEQKSGKELTEFGLRVHARLVAQRAFLDVDDWRKDTSVHLRRRSCDQ
jgi:hypothetical protein